MEHTFVNWFNNSPAPKLGMDCNKLYDIFCTFKTDHPQYDESSALEAFAKDLEVVHTAHQQITAHIDQQLEALTQESIDRITQIVDSLYSDKDV